MITKITILSNGSIAPNRPISLGNKYENVGDKIQFDIPREYQGYHYYLAFYMKKKDTILLPVNYEDGSLQFTITTTITKNPGQYEIIFLATERAIKDGNIDNARAVFISTTMYGNVVDNFLDDPVIDEQLDPNLQIIYDELLDLRDEILEDLETDYYRGASYIPDVDVNGFISWTRSDDKDINIPTPRNITGPQGKQGPYYLPEEEDGIITWNSSEEGMPVLEDIDLNPMVKNTSDAYLDKNLGPIVESTVNEKIMLNWDDKNQILYIFSQQNGDSTENIQDLVNNFSNVNIVATNNLTKAIKVPANHEAIIDLNGYEWNVEESDVIENEGSLTIKNGVIKKTENDSYYLIDNKGKLTLKGNTIVEHMTAIGKGSAIVNSGNLIIENGKYHSEINALIKNNPEANLVINNGIFSTGKDTDYNCLITFGTATINGGKWYGNNIVKVDGFETYDSICTINNGEFNVYENGEHAIKKGNYSEEADVKVIINGGTFNGPNILGD